MYLDTIMILKEQTPARQKYHWHHFTNAHYKWTVLDHTESYLLSEFCFAQHKLDWKSLETIKIYAEIVQLYF